MLLDFPHASVSYVLTLTFILGSFSEIVKPRFALFLIFY